MSEEVKEFGIYKRPLMRSPMGGWRIKVDGIEFTGKSHEDLAKQITDYLQNHDKDVGDINRRLEQFFCDNNPHMCLWFSSLTEAKLHSSKMKDDLIKWLRTQAWRNCNHLPSIDSKFRKAKCEGCEFNKQLDIDDPIYKTDMFKLTKGANDPTLGICEFHRWDNKLACLIEEPFTENDEPPDNCWRNGY